MDIPKIRAVIARASQPGPQVAAAYAYKRDLLADAHQPTDGGGG